MTYEAPVSTNLNYNFIISAAFALVNSFRGMFGCLSYIISVLFPFKYPMKFDTLSLGGILTHICAWSMHTAPPITYTPLYLQSVDSISRTSRFTWPYSFFFLYFGINTIWYWHCHLVCDKLFLSIWTASCSEIGLRHHSHTITGGFSIIS